MKGTGGCANDKRIKMIGVTECEEVVYEGVECLIYHCLPGHVGNRLQLVIDEQLEGDGERDRKQINVSGGIVKRRIKKYCSH